jgi:hypothetical protein
MRSLSQSRSAIDGQLRLYEVQADAWKADHDRAMDCLESATTGRAGGMRKAPKRGH